MKISHMIGADCGFSDEVINLLSFSMEDVSPESEAFIGLNLSEDYKAEQSDEEALIPNNEAPVTNADIGCVKVIVKYPHPLTPGNFSYITLSKDQPQEINFFEQVVQMLNQASSDIQSQQNCEHEHVRPSDQFGQTFGDGRAICTKCELKSEDILPNAIGDGYHPIAKIGLGPEKDFVCQHPWPKDILLQSGGSGLVLSGKKSYTTAFFEAFPKVDGYGTFIRGEGATLLDAENACFQKYETYLNCDGHEFSRMVNGAERTDGCGTCVKCGMFSGEALPPSTTCTVCEKPTKLAFKKTHYCHAHYYALPVEEIVNNALENVTDKRSFLSDSNPSLVIQRETLHFIIKQHYLSLFGEPTLIKHDDRLSGILLRTLSSVNKKHFDINLLGSDDVDYPDIDHPVMARFIQALKDDMPNIHYAIESKETYNFEWINNI